MRPLIPLFFVLVTNVYAQGTRARELGIAALIGGTPGPLDAITDVAEVEVGHSTLISGSDRLIVGTRTHA